MNIERKNQILELRKNNKSIDEICLLLGIKKGTVGYYLKNSNIKLSVGKGNKKPKSEETKRKISEANKGKKRKPWNRKDRFDYTPVLEGKVELNNQYYSSHTMRIKKWLFDFYIKKYNCEECNISDYNGKPISLELDHIDGNRNNNKLNNLKILCPNCHSQTHTYKGRNK